MQIFNLCIKAKQTVIERKPNYEELYFQQTNSVVGTLQTLAAEFVYSMHEKLSQQSQEDNKIKKTNY